MAKTSSLAAARESERYFQAGTALRRVVLEAPFFPRCSDDKTAAKVRPVEFALRHPYMQVNRPGRVSWLIFDLDHTNPSIWEDVGLPAPNLIVANRSQGPGGGDAGRAHLFYAITPVCTTERARSRPIDYMKAIYLEMARRLRADPNYASGPVAKTPGHPWWMTTELHATVYELGKLADYVDLEPPYREGSRTASNHVPHSRHCQLFEVLRHYAYSIVGRLKSTGSYEQFVALLEAYSLNAMGRVVRAAGSSQGDLPWSSVKATVKSVARWTWEHYRGAGGVHRGVMQLDESMPLEERQRLAALRTHELRAANTESRIRAACRALQAQGKPLLQTAVAQVAKLTRQTVATYQHVLREVVEIAEVVTPFTDASRTRALAVKHAVHQVSAARQGPPRSGMGLPVDEGSPGFSAIREEPS